MTGADSAGLLGLSLAIAVMAADTAFTLARRSVGAPRPRDHRLRLAGGAATLGIGVWFTQFLDMSSIGRPFAAGSQLGTALWSPVVAAVLCGASLWLCACGAARGRRVLFGGILMGSGIGAALGAGMASMPLAAGGGWSVSAMTGMGALTVAAATIALRLTFPPTAGAHELPSLHRAAAAAAMGVAVAGLPYLTMTFAMSRPGPGGDDTLTAVLVAGLTSGVLSGALIMSLLHRRLESRTRKLAESLQSANDQLRYVATHDALTGLPNRLLLIDRVQQAMHSSNRSSRACAVIYLDLDGFKPVNDSLGHAAGDALLMAVAERLQGRLRRHDTLARVGGDEFVILIEDLRHPDDAMDVCEAIVVAMCKPVPVNGTPLHVTVSMGIAVFPGDGFSVETLLRNADAAMYEVKQSGRNGYRYFESAMNANALRMLRIQSDLQRALDEGQLSLHFQPTFDARARRLSGAEALLRWQHPEMGLIGPDEFMPIAERCGLILDIGAWVIQEVCRCLAQWRNQGLAPLTVAVNLSARQLRQRNLAEHIYTMVRSYGLDPALLIMEIAETTAMEDAEANAEAVRRLQQRGLAVALDDFGRGYSSLSYLQRFRVSQIKVDRFFIAGLESGEAGVAAIVAAIVALGHALHLAVVAEGVETESQAATLRRLGCDELQGFLLGRPMPADEFAALLAPAAARRAPAALHPELG